MWRPEQQPQSWPHTGVIVGPVTSPTRAYRLAHDYCSDVTIRFGVRHGEAARVAYERLILQLAPGEPIVAICAAKIDRRGAAVLAATPRRLLGDGDPDWTCDVPWAAFDVDGDEPWLTIAGADVELTGPQPYPRDLLAVAHAGAR